MDVQRWTNTCRTRSSYSARELHVDGGPLEAFLEISARCNLRCQMCKYWRTRSEQRLPAEVWRDVLSQLVALGCRKVLLPLMRENGGGITITASTAGLSVVPVDPCTPQPSTRSSG